MTSLTALEHLCPSEITEFNEMAQRARLPLLSMQQEETWRDVDKEERERKIDLVLTASAEGRTLDVDQLLQTTTTEGMSAGDRYTATHKKSNRCTETEVEDLDGFVARWVTNELNHGTIRWRDDYELHKQEKRMRELMNYFLKVRTTVACIRDNDHPVEAATVPERLSPYVEITEEERSGFEELVQQGIPRHYIHQEIIRREIRATEKQNEKDQIRAESERRKESERIKAEAERQKRIERTRSETKIQRYMRRLREESLQWNQEDREEEERRTNLGRIEEETESKLRLESLVSATNIDAHRFIDFSSPEDWIRRWIPTEYRKQKVYERYLYDMAVRNWNNTGRNSGTSEPPETPDGDQRNQADQSSNQVKVKASHSTQVEVKACHSTQVEVKACHSTQVEVKACHSTKIEVKDSHHSNPDEVKGSHSSQIFLTQAASATSRDTVPLLKKTSKTRAKVQKAFERFREFTRDVWGVFSCKSVTVI